MASVEKRIQEEILRDLDMTREISDEELLGIIRQKICDAVVVMLQAGSFEVSTP